MRPAGRTPLARAVTHAPRAASLGEHAIRDLNDEINKLLREKGHWERQIRALGGPNYSAQVFDADGLELPGRRGYKCARPTAASAAHALH